MSLNPDAVLSATARVVAAEQALAAAPPPPDAMSTGHRPEILAFSSATVEAND
jgi:hypothetical protein